MTTPDVDGLQARVAELEAELTQLRAQAPPTLVLESTAPAAAARSGHRARSVLSATVIVIALLLAPLAVVAGFARIQLTDTDAFVATFAPLADDPSVQADIQDAVVDTINSSVDIPGLTGQLFDGIAELDLPDPALDALGLLEAPAVNGIQSLIDNLVAKFVTSDAFSDTFRQALTISHDQLVATMTNGADSAISISDEGGLVLNLKPIVAEVKERLVANGLAFADRIPDVDRTIVLAQSDALVQAQMGYNLVVAVGTWLPFVALLLLAGGVLIAVHHRATLMRTGIALGALMLLLWAGIAIGRVIAVGQLAPDLVSAGTATVLYDTLVDQMTRTVVAVGLLGVVIALVALFTGPSRFASRTRAVTASTATGIREAGQRHGLTTGPVGPFVDRYHAVVLAVIGVVALAVIAFSRPITPATVIWTCVLGLVAVFLVQVLRAPASTVEQDEAAASTAEQEAVPAS